MKNSQSPDNFRDQVATIDKEGNRNWIYPKKPAGKFFNRRVLFSIFCLITLFVVPFIKVHGEPLFLFNILERKFILMGIFFGPQDFFLFGLSMITLFVFIVLFTVVFGRLWCGWACPQTIFMEMVFRRIEYFIEGDSNQQKALNKSPWNSEKIMKKGSKYSIFLAISFIISNTLLAYIVGVDQLFKIISEPITDHLALFFSVLIFTGVFYFIFAWFREQACIVVCPYGRLQGVLLDKNSINVAYDYVRGETRGKIKKDEKRTEGDCIDCSLCVQVCPTGIDIRNGTQLECVNCTACIDVCDSVMEKVNFPKGLIRYASENNIANNEKTKFSTRIKAYTAVLVILFSGLVYGIVNRNDLQITITRAPGALFQEVGKDSLSNLYTFKIYNKSHETKDIKMKLEDGLTGEIKLIALNDLKVEKEQMLQGTMFVVLPRTQVKKRKNEIHLGLYHNGIKLTSFKTNFLGIEN